MPEFTTRTLASDVTDLEQEYPYIYWMPDFQCLAISKNEITYEHLESSNGIMVRNFNDDITLDTWTLEYYFLAMNTYASGDAYRLFYNDVTGWEVQLPDYVETSYGSLPESYYCVFGREERFTYYSNVAGNLPSTIPEFENLEELINEAINSTTSTTSQAVSLQNNINTQTQRYEDGELTGDQLQLMLDMYDETLTELANYESNTLVDQMAINNAQNALQIAQDKLNQDKQIANDNQISQDLIEAIKSLIPVSDEFQSFINDGFTPTSLVNEIIKPYLEMYNSRYLTKDEAIWEGKYDAAGNDIMPSLIDLKTEIQMMLSSIVKSEADIQYVNYFISEIDNAIEIIQNSGDVDTDISEEMRTSDEAEKQYLDSLTSETTASIQDISPKNSFSDVEMGTAQEVLGIIWDNKLVKRLLVICGCFMVVCVVLGIRYKV